LFKFYVDYRADVGDAGATWPAVYGTAAENAIATTARTARILATMARCIQYSFYASSSYIRA
jgi:hypothetical protein